MLAPGRDRRRASADLPLLPGAGGGLGLAPGRLHEFCGPARRSLAALTLAASASDSGTGETPVLWVRPAWGEEDLSADGLAAFLDPGQLLLIQGRSPADLLWAVEEALRAGVGRVVADLPEAPALTPVRRLQLAAEAGGGRALALLLTPEEGGAAGVTTRWSLAPAPGGGWRLVRLRARLAPPAAWSLAPAPEGPSLRPEPVETALTAAA